MFKRYTIPRVFVIDDSVIPNMISVCSMRISVQSHGYGQQGIIFIIDFIPSARRVVLPALEICSHMINSFHKIRINSRLCCGVPFHGNHRVFQRPVGAHFRCFLHLSKNRYTHNHAHPDRKKCRF